MYMCEGITELAVKLNTRAYSEKSNNNNNIVSILSACTHTHTHTHTASNK
jgi:hypothetical protein